MRHEHMPHRPNRTRPGRHLDQTQPRTIGSRQKVLMFALHDAILCPGTGDEKPASAKRHPGNPTTPTGPNPCTRQGSAHWQVL